MFSFLSSTVLVSLVDCATGLQFAASKMPHARLLDTFAVDTKLDIESSQYIVLRADPETKAEFRKTGKLTLILQKIELIDPRKVMFSLPTICDAALPEVTMAAPSGHVEVLHEDEWRQCEFVNGIHRGAISLELASIHRIRDFSSVGKGVWREIHIRTLLTKPLPEGITWSAVTALLGEFEKIGGISFGDMTNLVVDAVAVRFRMASFFGRLKKGGADCALCGKCQRVIAQHDWCIEMCG